jgi:catechol 2,3-dioxygenase-like lactoylglutathione lyase family enzyme
MMAGSQTTLGTDLLLEVVQIPVSDVDRAKAFYTEKVGFNLDFDNWHGEMRVVQLTPPGSACSIVIGTGLAKMPPGSLKGLQLVVADIRATHAALAERGLEVGEIQVFEPDGPRPMREGDELDNVGFAFFSDSDGNGWALQQISTRGSA